MRFSTVLRWNAAAWIFLFTSPSVFADPFALIGGHSGAAPDGYAAFLNAASVNPAVLNISPATIYSVSLNSSGQGLIGGIDGSNFYAAFLFAGEPPTVVPLLGASSGQINSVSINYAGQGLIGGHISSNAYAAFVNTPNTVTTITSPGVGNIWSVQLAPSLNLGVIGGDVGGSAYAAFVTPVSATAVPISLPASGVIQAVSINDGGIALLGGSAFSNLYAAFVNVLNPAAVSSVIFPTVPQGTIFSTAINSSDLGLIGGRDTTNNLAYASFVSPVQASSNLLSVSGTILSVALNNSAQGLIGGQLNVGAPYAAFVNGTTHAVTPIQFGFNNGIINSVAINQFGQALIGGQNNSAPYVALIDFNYPSHPPIVIQNLPSSGEIFSLSYVTSPIPTTNLHGNNLAFANYINKNAPRDLFYLYPSVFDGQFASALESAAPTRNMFSLVTADNNLFLLNHGLSTHLRNERHFRQRLVYAPSSNASVAGGLEESNGEADDLIAFGELGRTRLGFGKKSSATSGDAPCIEKESPFGFWFEAIGALAYQKAQNQTPGFDPSIGGGILAFDGQIVDATRFGIGAAYTYTYIHDRENAGFSHINQEYAFLYMTTSDERWYFDLAFWGGLFQINQARKIHLVGWDFESKSTPNGWQINPHIEMGYDYVGRNSCSQQAELVVNLFVMVDWVSAWQQSYKEKGNSPFNAGQKSYYSSFSRAEGGLRFYEPIAFESWNLTFEEKFSYVNKAPQKLGTMQAFLVGSPGSFTVETLTEMQNLGVVELSMIFASKGPSGSYASLTYQGELNGSYQLHQLMLEYSCDF